MSPFDFACDTDQTFTFDIANDDALNIQIALAGKVTFDHRSYGDDGFSAAFWPGRIVRLDKDLAPAVTGPFFTRSDSSDCIFSPEVIGFDIWTWPANS